MLGDTLRCVTYRAPGAAPRATASTFLPRGDCGPGTPLFLAPGFGLDGRSFERISPLAAARRVAYWNFPNAVPAQGGLAALGRLYLRHADLAGMPQRFVFGGSSLGGSIALAAALDAPNRCAGLILIGTTASWRQLGTHLHISRLFLPLIPSRGFHRNFATILFGQKGRADDLDALRLQAEHRTKPHAEAVTRLLLEDGPFDLGHRLHEIGAPTLVLHDPGEKVVPFEAGETLARIRTARLVEIPRSGHLPYVSRPDACLAALEPFLADIDRRERA